MALPEVSKCSAKRAWLHQAIVSLVNRQPEHTHSGNVATALARNAVGDMKTTMTEMNATSSSSQASVAARLDNDVLMALPKRNSVARTLQRARQKAATAAAGGTPLPPVPADLQFTIPSAFMAPRATVTVPVSPPDRVDVRHSARNPTPESFVSAGYNWSESPVGKKISGTERPCDPRRRSLWSCRSTCISSFHRVLVACMNSGYCNCKYCELSEHYVNRLCTV